MAVPGFAPETGWLWAAMAGYGVGTLAAWRSASQERIRPASVLYPLAIGVALLAFALGERWIRTGHGPFLTLFEVLLSNLFSLGLIYGLIYWRYPASRAGAIVALPMLLVLGLWTLGTAPESVPLPATYHNPWLWAHVGVGKLFLGMCLAAAGLAGTVLIRRLAGTPSSVKDPPQTLDAAWRLMAVAFVFHTAMLIAGAAWARDAWGRFWSWDSLETWALMTWLMQGAALHVRLSYDLSIAVSALIILIIFATAVLTFFGVPFFSVSPHKGIV